MGTRPRGLIAWAAVWLLWVLVTGPAVAAPSDGPEGPTRSDRENVVMVLEISGAITHQTEELLASALHQGDTRRARAVLIILDTPGGLLDATRAMVQRILDAPLPVLTLVSPAGARAASAGLFLTLASHVAAMHPTSHIGAAHPVAAFGRDIEGDMGEKVVSDTAAWARSLAQARGRDGSWAEKAVRESVSLTATEALENHVIELLAEDAEALLAGAEGRVAMVQHRPWRVATKGAALLRIEPTARQRLYMALANPVLVYLLLIAGVLGLFIESTSPGLIVPGVLGVSCLGIVFGVQVLPMNGFGLLLLGVAALLFIAEVYVTSFGLLAAAGLVCLAVGSYLLFDVPGSSLRLDARVIGATVVGAALVALGFGYKLMQVKRQGVTSGPETWLGREARVTEPIPAGGEGRVFFDGTLWTATSLVRLERDQRCSVTAVDGLLLHVTPVASSIPEHQ
jgi:membrane-bound serine protease (ClpP class)